MGAPITTQHRANVISIALAIPGVLILFLSDYTNEGIPILLGSILMIRQYLRGRYYDIFLTGFVFAGMYFTYESGDDWTVVLPVAFTTAACYLILREFLVQKQRVGLDEIEDLSQEIEEEQDDEHPRKD